MRSGGGLAAILYSWRKARQAGGVVRFYRRMRMRNACKTCALGMGGQRGGMHNETGNALEVCKKALQAQAADMQPPIPAEFFRRHSHAELLGWDSKRLEDAGRVGFPLLYEDGAAHWRRIAWDDAFERAATALRSTPPARALFYASGRSSNEAAFLLQCFARVYGTNNVNNCSYYCHQATGVGLGMAIGTGTATVTQEDLEHADFALLLGANPASNHPRLITRLVDIRRRGGTVVVVNPLREVGLVRFRIPSRPASLLFGSRVSDLYVQPHIGGDIAFLNGVAKAVIEAGGLERDFVDRYTTGFDAVEHDLRTACWEDLEAASGVPRATMQRVAELYMESERAVFLWAMGITQHAHGVDNVLAIVNLALLRGMIGKPNAGLLPIRGHSNVQGVGSVGVTPALKEAFARALEQAYGITLPAEKGLDTFAGVEAMGAGRIQTAVYLGGNLFSATPDSEWAARCMQRVETAVYISTKLNPGHFHGRGRTTLVLPARTRDEEAQATTQESMFSYVRLSAGGAPPLSPEMRSEVEIVAGLAGRVLPRGPIAWERWTSHRTLRAEMARVVPGFAAIGSIDDTKSEFTIAGRIHHEPRFATGDGRARFHRTPVPEFALRDDELRLMTLRSEGQFNTVVYEYEDIYRGADGRDVVFMHPEDAGRLGLRQGDRVRLVATGDWRSGGTSRSAGPDSEASPAGTVASRAGAVAGGTSRAGHGDIGTPAARTSGLLRVLLADIRSGNLAVYYPEANVLVPRHVDPRSQTPAFKSLAVRVEPAGAEIMATAAVAAVVAR